MRAIEVGTRGISVGMRRMRGIGVGGSARNQGGNTGNLGGNAGNRGGNAGNKI